MVDKEKTSNEIECEKENDVNDHNDTKQCVNRIVIKPKVTTNIDISGINVSRQIS